MEPFVAYTDRLLVAHKEPYDDFGSIETFEEGHPILILGSTAHSYVRVASLVTGSTYIVPLGGHLDAQLAAFARVSVP